MSTIREWIVSYKDGEIKERCREKEFNAFIHAAEWRDWFCENDELYNRTHVIAKIICSITNENILDNYTIGLYNNCPIVGDLYDEIVLYSIEDSENTGAFIRLNDTRSDKKYDLLTFYDFDHGNKDDARAGNLHTVFTDDLNELIRYINSVDKKFFSKK